MNGIRTKGSTLVFGDFGLKAVGPGWVTAREIEAARRAITGYGSVADRFGFDCSQTSLLALDLLRPAWVVVRVPWTTGLQ